MKKPTPDQIAGAEKMAARMTIKDFVSVLLEVHDLRKAKKRLIQTSRKQVRIMDDLEKKVLSLEQRYKTDSQRWIEQINELQEENKNT